MRGKLFMFNVFKKAKLADKYALQIKDLKAKLSNETASVHNLIEKCERAQKSLDDASAEIEKLFKKNLKLASEVNDLTSELTEYKKLDAANNVGDLISKTASEIQSYKDEIKYSKLCDFLDNTINTKSFNINKLNAEDVKKIYDYITCIKALSVYINANGLTIRKK